MDLSAFYGAFSPACFALLGLWLVVVQIRTDWWGHSQRMRRAYGIALLFALPGLMSVLALIDTQTHTFWRISFAIVGLSGALVLALVLGLAGAARLVTSPGPCKLPGPAVALAVLRGRDRRVSRDRRALAAKGGQAELRSEAVLQTVLVFLGFNAGWLLLMSGQKAEDPAPRRRPPRRRRPARHNHRHADYR